jgi:ureidoglycolate hydrolase
MATEAVRNGRSVVTERLSAEAWAPFGWLPVADTDPADGAHRMAFEWGDAHVNLIGHARTEVPETGRGFRCEMLYRHDTHTQALMPLNVPGVIAVAPAGTEFADVADTALIHAFRIEPLEGLVLHQGTWHWGPFPIEGSEVRLFNVQGLRYAEDNRCMDLAAKGMAVDVDLGHS